MPLTLTGCLSDGLFSDRGRDRYRAKERDPLTGLPSRDPSDQRIATTSPTSTDRVTAATLASSSGRTPEGVSGLGIRDGSSSGFDGSGQSSNGWTGADSNTAAPAGGAQLGSPKLAGPTDRYSAPPPGSSQIPAMRIRSFEEAQQFLVARGVKWQRLQMQSGATGPGEWSFSCTIPNRNNPNNMKTYEAHDKYGREAIQKVIDEIIRDQGIR